MTPSSSSWSWRGNFIRDGKLVIARRQDERYIMIAWLTRVAENRVRALQREAWKAARHEVFADDFAGEDPVPRLEAREALRQATWRVNRAESGVLRGVAMGDTLDEIAAALGIPLGTAGTTIRRVRRTLRKQRRRE